VTVHPFIEAEKQAGHSVKRACELLEVSRAAFYARRSGEPGPRAVRDAGLTDRSPRSTPTRGEATEPLVSMPCSGKTVSAAAAGGSPG
jgi:hypothetical protein